MILCVAIAVLAWPQLPQRELALGLLLCAVPAIAAGLAEDLGVPGVPTSARYGEGIDLLKLHGQQLREYRKNIQVIFQDPFSSLNPRMRVAEIIEEGMVAQNKGGNAAERQQRIEQLLDYILLLRKRQFGRSSEASKYQINLFDEAELEALLEELALPLANWVLEMASRSLESRLATRDAAVLSRTMSVTSSITPAMEENSWSTPSIFTEVIAAPWRLDSSTRRRELPRVMPKPRSRGRATNLP